MSEIAKDIIVETGAKSNTQKVIEKLELVQNINNAGMLKVSGEAIDFAAPVDEFARYLISEIPNLFRYVKIMSNMKLLDNETKNGLAEDAKIYIDHFESLGDQYLKESKCNQLVVLNKI
ncbi:MAG: hypothetical protein J6Z11_12800 [Candidatus Riflebacteria bacterium]|nr:hypothetical protein [Candidatus Riflebacteria bacterium]